MLPTASTIPPTPLIAPALTFEIAPIAITVAPVLTTTFFCSSDICDKPFAKSDNFVLASCIDGNIVSPILLAASIILFFVFANFDAVVSFFAFNSSCSAATLARFQNVMGVGQNEIRNIGSAIVDLGNHSATTESEIAEMALRMGKYGSSVRMSAADVLGYSSALLPLYFANFVKPSPPLATAVSMDSHVRPIALPPIFASMPNDDSAAE